MAEFCKDCTYAKADGLSENYGYTSKKLYKCVLEPVSNEEELPYVSEDKPACGSFKKMSEVTVTMRKPCDCRQCPFSITERLIREDDMSSYSCWLTGKAMTGRYYENFRISGCPLRKAKK